MWFWTFEDHKRVVFVYILEDFKYNNAEKLQSQMKT